MGVHGQIGDLHPNVSWYRHHQTPTTLTDSRRTRRWMDGGMKCITRRRVEVKEGGRAFMSNSYLLTQGNEWWSGGPPPLEGCNFQLISW